MSVHFNSDLLAGLSPLFEDWLWKEVFFSCSVSSGLCTGSRADRGNRFSRRFG